MVNLHVNCLFGKSVVDKVAFVMVTMKKRTSTLFMKYQYVSSARATKKGYLKRKLLSFGG